MNYYTYIVLCQNKKYYVGHSGDPTKRFKRHASKTGARFTSQNSPVRVVWKQKFATEIEAVRREKQIKGWARSKKENLVAGIWT